MVVFCMAVGGSVEKTRASRARASNLGIDDFWHGNVGRKNKQPNNVRDRKHCLRKLHAHGPKAFLRRFKIRRPLFDKLVEKIGHIVEPNIKGIEIAEFSCETYVLAELLLAASLRWLASGSYMCQKDNYGIGTT